MKKKADEVEAPRVVDLARQESEARGFRGDKSMPVRRLKPQIVEALSLGYSRKLVWRALLRHGLINMGYDRFRVLCNELGMVARGGSAFRAASKGAAAKRVAKQAVVKKPAPQGNSMGKGMGFNPPARQPWEPDLKEIYGEDNE